MTESPGDRLLLDSLPTAVKAWMDSLYAADGPSRRAMMRRWCAAAADQLPVLGDIARFGGRRDQVAEAFNHIARAIAALAFCPGGVTFAGTHWCSDHDQCRQARRTTAVADRYLAGA